MGWNEGKGDGAVAGSHVRRASNRSERSGERRGAAFSGGPPRPVGAFIPNEQLAVAKPGWERGLARRASPLPVPLLGSELRCGSVRRSPTIRRRRRVRRRCLIWPDRKSVVWGKSVEGRVNLGGRR